MEKFCILVLEMTDFQGGFKTLLNVAVLYSKKISVCDKKPEIRFSTIEEFGAVIQSGDAPDLVNWIYKYVANITGSDPYWYHIKRQLTTQANQEGLKGAVFFTVSVEDYHWRNMMRLIYVPNGADITT